MMRLTTKQLAMGCAGERRCSECAGLSARRATSWMGDAQVGRSVGVCFLLSAYSYAATLAQDGSSVVGAEAAREADLLFLQVAETPQLITARTPYSNRTKRGRGMPTFKQFAFFRHAATMLPGVAFVGKIDDDTAVNLRVLGPLLVEARCLPYALLGSIQWSGFIPRHHATGVRGDRCGFSWDWLGALREYGQCRTCNENTLGSMPSYRHVVLRCSHARTCNARQHGHDPRVNEHGTARHFAPQILPWKDIFRSKKPLSC